MLMIFQQNIYGNNQVWGPDKKDALHGTHVAGIIAQVRGNNLGGDGVATHVEIMAVRAVPNGDEYDKDIALAIRYAVDNGAKVINGSFGKAFSPHKEWVYEAIKYAAEKDVLFVHAAGNDGENMDVIESYPNDLKDGQEIAANFIKIGALNFDYGSKLSADFSNYGKNRCGCICSRCKNLCYRSKQRIRTRTRNFNGIAKCCWGCRFDSFLLSNVNRSTSETNFERKWCFY